MSSGLDKYPPSLKAGVILGGFLSPQRRRDALEGVKPGVDVMEMEAHFPAKLYDYTWFERKSKSEIGTRMMFSLANRIGHWSDFLSLRAVKAARDLDLIYTSAFICTRRIMVTMISELLPVQKTSYLHGVICGHRRGTQLSPVHILTNGDSGSGVSWFGK